MNFCEYIEAFVRLNYRCANVNAVIDDFISAASSGVYRGGYMKRTIPNLVASYKAGKSVESLCWEGK